MQKIQNLIKNTIYTVILSQFACTPETRVTEKEQFIDSLMNIMTLEEKIGQMTLYTSGWDVTGPVMRTEYKEDIRKGNCGNVFNAHTVAYNYELQKIAVEETRLGIPLMFGYDVIHGHKTIFPIPLAEACAWDPELTEQSARYSTMEGAASGLNWTFSPMVDLARDPRWGRVAEGTGEDPYLGSLFAAAKVKGIQGANLGDPLTLAACVKHFAAYGAPVAGRDYNTVELSERVFSEIYLPPYKAAIDAGAVTVMTAFNEVFDVPSSGSKYLLSDILKKEWGFSGFVVTDYTSIPEMVKHGYAEDEKHSGERALNAGVDMDMQGAVYYSHLSQSLEEGKVTIHQINDAVKRILGVKYDLGLFEDPFRYLDENREKEILFSEEIMDHALIAARKSAVLLKNEPFRGEKILPLKKNIRTIALLGPLADNKVDLMGSWHASGDAEKVITLRKGLEKKLPDCNISYAKACSFNDQDKSGFREAIQLAKNADVVILAVGEDYITSGEAASRTNIGLPGVQEELVMEILKTGKPVVVIFMAGRPLTFENINEKAHSILYAWQLGTRAGDAIADILVGDYNPSAKTVITFPRNTGQIPVYYNAKNTGRPYNANDKYTSKYIDAPNEPLYPFGYGLSYAEFEYDQLTLDKSEIGFHEELTITVQVRNIAAAGGEEIVQLYTRDMVGSVTRPVKELKGFQKVWINGGDSVTLSFTLNADQLKFYDIDMNYVAEAGKFMVYVGSNSSDVLSAEFSLVEK